MLKIVAHINIQSKYFSAIEEVITFHTLHSLVSLSSVSAGTAANPFGENPNRQAAAAAVALNLFGHPRSRPDGHLFTNGHIFADTMGRFQYWGKPYTKHSSLIWQLRSKHPWQCGKSRTFPPPVMHSKCIGKSSYSCRRCLLLAPMLPFFTLSLSS